MGKYFSSQSGELRNSMTTTTIMMMMMMMMIIIIIIIISRRPGATNKILCDKNIEHRDR